jgi:tryptophan synthase alpha subunit
MKTNDPKTVTQSEKKVMEKMFHLSQIKELEKKIRYRWGQPAVTDMTYLNMVFSDEYENLTKHVNKILQINRWLQKNEVEEEIIK